MIAERFDARVYRRRCFGCQQLKRDGTHEIGESLFDPGASPRGGRANHVHERRKGGVALDNEAGNLAPVSRVGHRRALRGRGDSGQVHALGRVLGVRHDVDEKRGYRSHGGWWKTVATRRQHDAASSDTVNFERDEVRA